MNFARFALPLILALGLTCDCPAQSLSKPKNSNKPGGVVAGRITAGGKSLAGVSVVIGASNYYYNDDEPAGRTITDADGRFRFSGVPAGTYQVTPLAPIFVVAGQNGFEFAGKAVVVAEGETVEGVDFAVVRGGVITGKVTGLDGRAVIDEQIRLFAVDPNTQKTSQVYLGRWGFRTDDRGYYRLFGIPAGRYKVAIGDSQYSAFTSTRGRRAYKQTFHPDVTEETKANVIEIKEGSEASNVDITVGRMMDGFAVSGRIVDGDTEQPLAGLTLGLSIIVNGRASGFMSFTGGSDSRGEFRIDNMPPGKYAVTVLPGAGTDYHGESAPFDIIDQEITGLEIKAVKAASLSGTIVVQGIDDPAVLARLSRWQLQVFIHGEGSSVGMVSGANVNADGSFRIGGLQSGIATISFASPGSGGLSPEFMILRIERDGTDQSRGIPIKAGEQIAGLRIVVGYGTGVVRGVVNFENGTFATGMQVFAQLQKQGDSSFSLKSAQVDERGHFVIDRVPAGNYDLVVSAYVPGMRGQRPGARQQIAVSDGVVVEVSITLNLKPNPTPTPAP